MTDALGLRRVGLAAAACLGAALMAVPVHASAFAAIWSEFEQRCLIPFEAFAAPVVGDLVPVAGRADAYHLPKGAVLVLGGETDDGSRSCMVEGAGLHQGYSGWVAQTQAAGRYIETDTPGQWVSHEWIEPRIIVDKRPGAVRVAESFLEL